MKDLDAQITKITAEQEIAHRPWGSFQTVIETDGYKVKRLVVNPGQMLSLQMHVHRTEHWVVVRGTAQIIVGEQERVLHENQSAYIPKSTRHRLANPGVTPLEIIEVQCGVYLEEDDIVRFEDAYGRC